MKTASLFLAVLLAACAGPPSPRASHAQSSTTAEILTTDDPAPFEPQPSEAAVTGQSAGIVVGGLSRQAVQVAQLFFDSIRTRDSQMLQDLMGSTVMRGNQARPSAEEIMIRLSFAERASFGLSASTGDYLDFAHASTATVAETYSGPIPPLLRADDVIVSIVVRPLGLEMTEDMMSNTQAVRMIIRMHPHPRIVGY
jgi:hypothetical protein